MLGKQLQSAYGWGHVTNTPSSFGSTPLKLDWNATLFINDSSRSTLKQSFADIGSCALLQSGETCLLLDYNRLTGSHVVLVFRRETPSATVLTPSTIEVPAADMVRVLPVCVGLAVTSTYGIGVVRAYRPAEGLFEVAYAYGTGYMNADTVSFPTGSVYPTACYILDTFILQDNENASMSPADAVKPSAAAVDLTSPVSSPTAAAAAPQSHNHVSTAVAAIRRQIRSYESLLQQASERVGQLMEASKGAAGTVSAAVTGSASTPSERIKLQKVGELLQNAYSSIRSIQSEGAEGGASATTEGATGGGILNDVLGGAGTDMTQMMRYYEEFSKLLSDEYTETMATLTAVVGEDPMLRDLLQEMRDTQQAVMTKLEVVTETKSYKALVVAREKMGGRLEALLSSAGGSSGELVAKLREKIGSLMGSAGAQLLTKHGGDFLEQCRSSPQAAVLMENLFQQSCDSMFGGGVTAGGVSNAVSSFFSADAERSIRSSVLALTSALHSADSSLGPEDGAAAAGAGGSVNASSFFAMMVVSMLNMTVSAAAATNTISGNASTDSSITTANTAAADTYDMASLKGHFSKKNGILKHTLCLKLCAILQLIVAEEEANVAGKRVSGTELLMRYRDYPMQSMITMFNMFSNRFSVMKAAASGDIDTGNPYFNQLISASASMLEQYPSVNDTFKQLTSAAVAMSAQAKGATPQDLMKLMDSNAAIGGVKAALDSDYAESAVHSMVASGDKLLTSVENMRDNVYVQQAMQHMQQDMDTDDLLNYAINKATSTPLDVNAMMSQVETLVSDKVARQRLVDMWKDQILDFLIGLLPSMSIPDIDGIQSDLQYHIAGLDMSGIKLKKEEVTITLVDSLFEAAAKDESGVKAAAGVETDCNGDRVTTMDLFRIHIGGISALFSQIEWKYLQLFFPHMRGDGRATATVLNASLDMGFKLVRVPKGVLSILASDEAGPYKSSKKLLERFKGGRLKAQLDAVVQNKTAAAANASANGGAGSQSPAPGGATLDVFGQAMLASEACDWGEDVTEWEPAFVLSAGGHQQLFTIEKLVLVTEQSSAVLSWLYNMIANIFEKTIKEYVCLSLVEMLESNAAVLLSYINSSMANYFPMISQVLKISVSSIPKASTQDLQMLIGPDPNADGYFAGPQREVTVKFTEPGSLGMKLDVVVQQQPAALPPAAGGSARTPSPGLGSGLASPVPGQQMVNVTKALVTGARENSQAERVFTSLPPPLVPAHLYMSSIVSINGKKTAGLDEELIMTALKNPKRPMTIALRLSDDVYSVMRNAHAEEVTALRKKQLAAQAAAAGSSKKAAAALAGAVPVGVPPRHSASVSSSMKEAGQLTAAQLAQQQRSKYRKLKVVKVTFQEGSLGLKLKETKSCGGAVIITGFAKPDPAVTSAKMLQAEALGVLEIGMIMLAVEDTVVFGQPFENVMAVIKKCTRPMSMLFVRSPDLQVVFPSYIRSITEKDLLLGMIEGYVMITANNVGKLLRSDTVGGGGDGPGSPVAAGAADTANPYTPECNCDKLLPGMVILQVNKKPVVTSTSGGQGAAEGVPQTVQDVYALMGSVNPIKLAIRDMDAFMHLIRIRDGVETIARDVEYA